MKPLRFFTSLVLLLGCSLPMVGAGRAAAEGAEPPANFDVQVGALPFEIQVSAPSVLPLQVVGGIDFSGVKLNSQPLVHADSDPVYSPLLGDIGLLGGPGAIPGFLVRLLPGLVLGLPTLFGLQPIPGDPSTVPVPPIPVFPAPPLPPTGCASAYPSEPRVASCGGPSQNLLGFDTVAFSGATHSDGDPADLTKVASDASVTAFGVSPAAGNTLMPLQIGELSSSARSRVVAGAVTADATTAVHDIKVAGILDIPTVRSSVSASVGGRPGSGSVRREPCIVSGATLAGIPVSIDADGLHLGGTSTPLPFGPTDLLLDQLLRQAGLAVRSVAGGVDPGMPGARFFPGNTEEVSRDGTRVRAGAACLEISYTIPASGTKLRFLFGQATADLSAHADTVMAGPSSEPASPPPSDRVGSIGTATPAADALPSAGPVAALPLLPPPTQEAAAAPIGGATIRPAVSAVRRPAVAAAFGWFALLVLAVPLLVAATRLGPRPRTGGIRDVGP